MLQRFMNMDKNKTELIHGDFFDNWMKTHPQSVDLILVDPPYGILKRAGQAWDEPIDWTMAERILAQLLSSTGRVIIFCNLSLLFQLSMQFKKHLIFKHLHIWNKPGGSPTNEYCPISDAEYIACFHRSDTKVNALTFNPWESGKVGKPYSKKNGQRSMKTKGGLKSEVSINHSGKRYSRTVINAPGKPNMVQSERTNHPTQKPLSISICATPETPSCWRCSCRSSLRRCLPGNGRRCGPGPKQPPRPVHSGAACTSLPARRVMR